MNKYTIRYKIPIKSELFSTAVLLNTHALKLRIIYTSLGTIEYLDIYWEDSQSEALKETLRKFIELSPNNTITYMKCGVELPNIFDKTASLTKIDDDTKETSIFLPKDSKPSEEENINDESMLVEAVAEPLESNISSTDVEEKTLESDAISSEIETKVSSEDETFINLKTPEETEVAAENEETKSYEEYEALMKVEAEPPKEIISENKAAKAEDCVSDSKEKVYSDSEINNILQGAYELLGYNLVEKELREAVGESLKKFYAEAKVIEAKNFNFEKIPMTVLEVTEKFCAAEEIKNESLCMAISLSFVGAPSYDCVFKAISKIKNKNPAMAKVEVTASFKRWLGKKYPQILNRYPNTELKAFLNLFRNENEKF